MFDSNLTLWEFACAVYAEPNVEKCCLRLQDDFDIDVPLLFFCYWSALRHGAVSVSQLQPGLELAQYWSELVVQPLRHIRRQMKVDNHHLSLIDRDEHTELREQIKALELQSEKQLLNALQALTLDWPLKVGTLDDTSVAIENCFGAETTSHIEKELLIINEVLNRLFTKVD
jgi:uncharacterized protein (TIGR02444 family)